MTRGVAGGPERILQFGTGRFLLGFVGDFVDRAIRAGCYDGRIVAVQSTGRDRADRINRQRGRYALVERGCVAGERVERMRVLAALSRALDAKSDWDEVLAIARSPDLDLIVSNSTEAGLALDSNDDRAAPRTFPGKLAAVLLERFEAGLEGPVVLPCELVEGNGDLLRAHVRALAASFNAPPEFARWIEQSCVFANTLVDRIVTGRPGAAELDRLVGAIGFDDGLVTIAEPYALWAIEGDARLRARVGFARGSPEIAFVPSIEGHRELKVRLLNGGHTALAALAMSAGFETVHQTVADPIAGPFIDDLLRREIAPTLPYPPDETAAYVNSVAERWSNPFLAHAWIDIAQNYRQKFAIRLAPTVERHMACFGRAPRRIALGVAAYLARSDPEERRDSGTMESAWGIDPSSAGDFAAIVEEQLTRAQKHGFRALLNEG